MRTRTHWTQKLTVIGLLVSLAALLGGCVQVTHKSVIAPDLTGSTTLRIGVSKAALMQAADLAGAGVTPPAGVTAPSGVEVGDMAQQIGDQISQLGGTAQPFDDGTYTGVDVFFNFSSLDEMTSQLNGLLSGTSGPSAQASQAVSAATTADQTGILLLNAHTLMDGGIRVDGNIDPLSLLNDPNNPLAALSPDLAQAITSDPNAQITLSFQMPGTIRATDAAAQRTGTTATWTFPIGSAPATLFVESDPR